MWCVFGRFAGLPLGRSAKLSSLLGAQLRQSHGRLAGLPFWEVSFAELPAGSSATPVFWAFCWPPFRRSASLGSLLKGGPAAPQLLHPTHHFPSHAKPLGRVACELRPDHRRGREVVIEGGRSVVLASLKACCWPPFMEVSFAGLPSRGLSILAFPCGRPASLGSPCKRALSCASRMGELLPQNWGGQLRSCVQAHIHTRCGLQGLGSICCLFLGVSHAVYVDASLARKSARDARWPRVRWRATIIAPRDPDDRVQELLLAIHWIVYRSILPHDHFDRVQEGAAARQRQCPLGEVPCPPRASWGGRRALNALVGGAGTPAHATSRVHKLWARLLREQAQGLAGGLVPEDEPPSMLLAIFRIVYRSRLPRDPLIVYRKGALAMNGKAQQGRCHDPHVG